LIPIPVETIVLLVGLNLPKEMADKVISKSIDGWFWRPSEALFWKTITRMLLVMTILMMIPS
jgi:hypothetical protein